MRWEWSIYLYNLKRIFLQFMIVLSLNWFMIAHLGASRMFYILWIFPVVGREKSFHVLR